jgi:hypothetical protein
MCNKEGRKARDSKIQNPTKPHPISNLYTGPLPRPPCDCKGWGCWGCCNSESRIRSMQGIFS